VYTKWGRRIELPDVNNPRLRSYAMRAAINAPIQGFEADIMRRAMVNINEQLTMNNEQLITIMQVHDEIVFECDEAVADGFATRIKNIMENVTQLSVPLLSDTCIGKEWGK
jgi:DNA polymerase-1